MGPPSAAVMFPDTLTAALPPALRDYFCGRPVAAPFMPPRLRIPRARHPPSVLVAPLTLRQPACVTRGGACREVPVGSSLPRVVPGGRCL